MNYEFVRDVTAKKKLYKLSDAVSYDDGNSFTDYVISSFSNSDQLPELIPVETIVFPANSNGEILDWLDLVWVRGVEDHEEAMRRLVVNANESSTQ